MTVTVTLTILSISLACTCIIQWGPPFSVGDPVCLLSTVTCPAPPLLALGSSPLLKNEMGACSNVSSARK